MQPGNALNWFEIPVSDFERSKKFYETIFDYQMEYANKSNKPINQYNFYKICQLYLFAIGILLMR